MRLCGPIMHREQNAQLRTCINLDRPSAANVRERGGSQRCVPRASHNTSLLHDIRSPIPGENASWLSQCFHPPAHSRPAVAIQHCPLAVSAPTRCNPIRYHESPRISGPSAAKGGQCKGVESSALLTLNAIRSGAHCRGEAQLRCALRGSSFALKTSARCAKKYVSE